MLSIENLIPDNQGNHLVVVLTFYEDIEKLNLFNIPSEFSDIEIVDISIRKLDLSLPIGAKAFFELSKWLMNQFLLFPKSIFTFICSTQTLDNHHSECSPEKYRWMLFEQLCIRFRQKLNKYGILSKNIIIGPEGYETYAKIFYRQKHSPIVHIVTESLLEKYFQ